MHFLVTGAQGFLGKHVVNSLREKGLTVTPTGRRQEEGVVCCDLVKAEEVVSMLDRIKPDRIIHCAAILPKTPEGYANSFSAQASLRMLELIVDFSTCPVVYISSMTVYGSERKRPVVEGDAGDPISAYGKAKWQGEKLLMNDGRDILVVRVPGLFGPSRREGLVYNVVKAAKYRWKSPQLPDKPILWAGMHVEDAASCIAKLAISGITGFELVNIGYSGKISINELITTACDLFGWEIDYTVSQPIFELDLSHAKSCDAIPTSSFRESLVKFGNQI